VSSTTGDESERGRTALLLRFREDLGHTWRGEGPEEPVLRGLIPTIRTRSLELDPCYRLVRASPAEQEVNRNLTEADPLSYCELSANPIGRIVLAVFGVQSAEAERLSDLVCTALQLIDHTQDIAEERRAGRLCVPQEDLAGYGVGEAELDAATSSPAPRELVAGQALRALDLLGVGERLRFAGAALALSRVDLAAPSSDQQSFGEWLAARGQSDRVVETLWDLVGVATLTATARLRPPTSTGRACRCGSCTATPPRSGGPELAPTYCSAPRCSTAR
jgi:hypothetical protein